MENRVNPIERRIETCRVCEVSHGDLGRSAVLRRTNLFVLPHKTSNHGAASDERRNDQADEIAGRSNCEDLHF
jgi:hypothetical protein